jgi:hypothetical protein
MRQQVIPVKTMAYRFALTSSMLLGAASLETLFASSSNAAAPPQVSAASAADFLDSIGVNTHVDQGYDPESYIEPLGYTGIRQVRDGGRNIASDIMIHRRTGVRFTIIGGGDLEGLLSAGRTLAEADALLALEGPNEPNNFPITYEGERGGGPDGSWMPIARFQKALYAAAKSDKVLRQYPIFGPSETGAETDNVGLQFLIVPATADTLLPKGTRFADFANVHNYVIGNGNQYTDNQAWNAADPILNARWDGFYGNHGLTWRKRYSGYTDTQLPAVPRVTTETGWDTTANPGGQHTQGAVLTNTYLAQFKRGWTYTFVYELRDGEGSTGDQGLYHGTTPKLAATYLHNMTTVLSDNQKVKKLGSVAYAIPNAPATVHSLLLQKSNGRFQIVVWGERVDGSDVVTMRMGAPRKRVEIYDITSGIAPVRTLTNVDSLQLILSDHAMIVDIGAN